MTCPACDDGDGVSIFPYYGLAPHKHRAGPVIGSTEILPEETWPANFTEDPESPGCGTYLYCLVCGK